jgi:ubiquinone/menaquinone biosynthesis C-methylase UbiE
VVSGQSYQAFIPGTISIMFAKVFRDLVDFSPKFSLKLWQIFYEYLASRFKKSTDWKYMNYGYAEITQTESVDFNVLSEHLYRHLFDMTELAGKYIMEVGCGRGGGCEILLPYKPASVTGLDFSENVIAFCQQTYKQENLKFVAGNAEALPFADSSFDVIINVESSHCYGNRVDFFKEVARTLKPCGYFLYADFMGRIHYHKRPVQLAACGLTVLNEKDITPNVLKALELSTPFKQALIKKNVIKPFRKSINDFVGTPGSNIYNRFANGDTVYFSILCRKA